MIKKVVQFKNNSGFKKYFFNTGWLLTEQILRIISSLFVSVWVARYLGPEQFGVISYAIAFTAIFASVAKLGLDGILVRELINHPESRKDYLGTTFWLKIIGGIFVLVLIALVLPFTSNDKSTNLYIFVIGAGLIFQSFEVVVFFFQSQVLGRIISIIKVFQLIISSLIKLYLISIEADLFWFVLITSIDTLTLGIGYYLAYKIRKEPFFYRSFDLKIAKNLIKDSWPFIFSNVIISIYMKIDNVMIMEMLGPYYVGQYSVAVTLSTAWYFLPTIIATSLFPAIVNSKKISEKLYIERLQKMFTLLLWIALLTALFVSFTSRYIVNWLYGESFIESADVLTVHIWSGLAVSYGIVWSKWILIENLQKFIIVFHLVSMIINILLNFLLIPMLGIFGAAIATAIASILAQSMGVLFYKRELAIRFLLRGLFPLYMLKNR